jgi:hypothetical protein
MTILMVAALAMPGSALAATAKEPQTITFRGLVNGHLPDRVFGDAPFAVAATSDSGLAVSFRIADGECSLTGPVDPTSDVPWTVHLTAPGSCSIVAYQDGNALVSYGQAQATFGIARRSQRIEFKGQSLSVGETGYLSAQSVDISRGHVPDATGLPIEYASADDTICSVFTDPYGLPRVQGNSGGTCYVTATHGGNDLWAPALPVVQAFDVSRLPQSITFLPITDKMPGDTFSLDTRIGPGVAWGSRSAPLRAAPLTGSASRPAAPPDRAPSRPTRTATASIPRRMT